MKDTSRIKDVLIKITLILIGFYMVLIFIRISITNDYEDTLCINNGVAPVENEDAVAQISIDTTEEETETFGTLENLKFTIDVTLVNVYENTYKGNTATADGYSGIIEFKLSDNLISNNKLNINVGDTYIIDTSPMIETSISGFPLVTATSLRIATKEDIKELEEVKSRVSTFNRKIIEYSGMSLEEIVIDANNSYATWTQDEVKEYIKFIEDKGYTDDKECKSYVCLRESISQVYSE